MSLQHSIVTADGLVPTGAWTYACSEMAKSPLPLVKNQI